MALTERPAFADLVAREVLERLGRRRHAAAQVTLGHSAHRRGQLGRQVHRGSGRQRDRDRGQDQQQRPRRAVRRVSVGDGGLSLRRDRLIEGVDLAVHHVEHAVDVVGEQRVSRRQRVALADDVEHAVKARLELRPIALDALEQLALLARPASLRLGGRQRLVKARNPSLELPEVLLGLIVERLALLRVRGLLTGDERERTHERRTVDLLAVADELHRER
jgi:hypothetical protein